MRILFVSISESIHTVRWLEYLQDQGWELHLFPSHDNGLVHEKLKNITVYHSIYSEKAETNTNVKIKGIRLIHPSLAGFCRRWLHRLFPNFRKNQLRKVIQQINPDIIHSMETQSAGYLVNDVYNQIGGFNAKWFHSIWGSDLFLFHKFKNHIDQIKSVLKKCDQFFCDSDRDEKLARELGFQKKIVRFPHIAGAINKSTLEKMTEKVSKPSERKQIVLKGYQSWAGRALVGLRGIERCAEVLKDWEIVVYACPPDVKLAAEVFQFNTGIKVTTLPPGSNNDILEIFSKSRIFIGLSISDGVPTSMLEAMSMGAFPIQSNTGCTEAFIKNQENGILVHPEEPSEVESAIRFILKNNELVDAVQLKNRELIQKAFNLEKVRKLVIDAYC